MRRKRSMRKYLFLFLLVGCAATNLPPTKEPTPSPEADISAPGMIPAECEALLQKSQEWGYHPGEPWKPSSLDQATEVANFLGNLTLVPDSTSRFFMAWKNLDPSTNEDMAKKRVDLAAKAQMCDVPLASTFLYGLLKFKWPQGRDEGKIFVHKFLLNQQARVSTVIVRALTIEVLQDASRKKLIPVQRGLSLYALRTKLEKSRSAILELAKDESSLGIEKSIRRDLELSEELRQELAKYLPLP